MILNTEKILVFIFLDILYNAFYKKFINLDCFLFSFVCLGTIMIPVFKRLSVTYKKLGEKKIYSSANITKEKIVYF